MKWLQNINENVSKKGVNLPSVIENFFCFFISSFSFKYSSIGLLSLTIPATSCKILITTLIVWYCDNWLTNFNYYNVGEHTTEKTFVWFHLFKIQEIEKVKRPFRYFKYIIWTLFNLCILSKINMFIKSKERWNSIPVYSWTIKLDML